MTKAFSIALKQQMVDRLTGVNAVSAAQLARETGITQQNLSRWLSEARNLPFGASNEIVSAWTVEEKARILAQAAALAGDELCRYLEGEGVRIAHFRRWRLALEEAGEESVGMAKRIRKLERELARKERALAEAATLLLLRETTGSQVQREDEVADELAGEAEELNSSLSNGVALVDTPTAPSSAAQFPRIQPKYREVRRAHAFTPQRDTDPQKRPLDR
jgi:DNA-binding phage protein